jgi:hypothetical protein
MKSFLQRFGTWITGILNGFDRLRLRGTKRLLASVGGLYNYLWQRHILLKDFTAHAEEITTALRQATEACVHKLARPLVYVPSAARDKEALAREIAQRDGVRSGLVCVLSSVEVCSSFVVYRNRDTRHLELRAQSRKCLHYYHYLLDQHWGWCHVRVQTWFPFNLHVVLNGREWLAQQLRAAGIGYHRRDNCFVDLADVERAQHLMDEQLRTNWPAQLNALAALAFPVEAQCFGGCGGCRVPYYWSVEQSEWASDVLFRTRADLARWYPRWLQHAMLHLHSGDVMRFLGKRLGSPGERFGKANSEVVTDLKERREGVRVKHRVNGNSVKMYDKQESVLRVETTVNQPHDMKVYRPKEGDPNGPKQWRYLRKGIADLHRRAEVCQKANERYLESLATVEAKTSLGELVEPLGRPVSWQGRRLRGLRPLVGDDARLLEVVARGEFLLNGFRNRDLRPLLFAKEPADLGERRRQSAAVTRKLRLLRAHGLIKKIPRSQRYQVTARGQTIFTTLLAARQADATKLTAAA